MYGKHNGPPARFIIPISVTGVTILGSHEESGCDYQEIDCSITWSGSTAYVLAMAWVKIPLWFLA